ncbi:MAG: hypothetical protein M3O36_14695 [Myxococcota bacterium]|nr:hypothetical protein [Myxococcota bacterium]
MSQRKNVRCYGYVERPYEQVRALLHREPLELLQRATNSASARTRALVANLRVDLAGVEIGVDVRTHVNRVRDEKGVAGLSPVTCVDLGWEAAHAPAIFPLMSARLSAWPITSTETQLELDGDYEPPLGPLGTALNAVVGHRIAEASVERLLQDVLEQLRREPTA